MFSKIVIRSASNMNTIFTFQTAKRLISGPNSLGNLKEELNYFKDVQKVLIITQDFLKGFPCMDIITSVLEEKGIEYDIEIGIDPEPTVANIEGIHKSISKGNYDLFIGIGGGSVLDATKMLSVLDKNDLSLQEMLGTELIPNKGVPMILIPTTSGTGSEVTPNAIITIPEEELKIGIVSRHFLPDLVILDPVLTVTLPPSITAATGMDAFTHSFESYISNKANPISDLYALESMKLIAKSIVTAYTEADNLQARQDMLLASTYGGMALTAAGTAAVHALAYPLGGKFNIPHGEANSMLLPHVTRFNLDAIEERMSIVAKHIGIVSAESDIADSKAAEKLIEQIEEWTKELNVPQELSDFGISESDIPDLSKAAFKVRRLLDNNPKELSVEDIENIYKRLL